MYFYDRRRNAFTSAAIKEVVIILMSCPFNLKHKSQNANSSTKQEKKKTKQAYERTSRPNDIQTRNERKRNNVSLENIINIIAV